MDRSFFTLTQSMNTWVARSGMVRSWAFIAVFMATLVAPQMALAAKPLQFAVTPPKNDWKKRGVVAKVTPDSIRLTARRAKPFNDASKWTLRLARPVGVAGKDQLAFTVKLGQRHQPLWGSMVLSVLVNGKPASPGRFASGQMAFAAAVSDDGRSFIPSGTQSVVLALPRGTRTIRSLSFVTAGADGLNITANNFRLVSPQRAKPVPITTASIVRPAPAVRNLASLRDDAWSSFFAFSKHTDARYTPYPRAASNSSPVKFLKGKGNAPRISGGWFDAGDYGQYSVVAAHSVNLMLITALVAPEAMPRRISPLGAANTSMADWKDLIRPQLDWLVTMQAASGGVHHKIATRKFPSLRTSPNEDKKPRWLLPVTSTATAQFAASMDLASMVFTGKRGARYRKAADRAHKWLSRNRRLVMIDAQYRRARFGGHYGDTNDGDERLLADTARLLVRGIGAQKVASTVRKRAETMVSSASHAGWQNNDLFALWLLHTANIYLDNRTNGLVEKSLRRVSRPWVAAQDSSPWGIAHGQGEPVRWGFNHTITLRSWHWLMAHHGLKLKGAKKRAVRQLAWFEGHNPLRRRFTTGPKGITKPHFRPYLSGAIRLPRGLLVGGPNGEPNTGDPLLPGMRKRQPLARHADRKESFATNEVAINWQTAWALVLSLAVR